jgi:hypothetical protein
MEMKMFKKLFKIPYWYLIAIPLLSIGLGTVSNQAVLWDNFDKFPVMYNAEKIQKACRPADAKNALAEDIIKALTGQKKSAAPDKTNNLGLQLSVPDPNVCANGGIFLDDIHVIMNKDSKLKFMADIWDFHDVTYSIGDFMLMFSDWMLGWSVTAWLVLVVRKLIE